MFAIGFDLRYHDTLLNHPKSVSQAYKDIESTLAAFAFSRVQGSVYVADSDDLSNLFKAIMALKALPWFPPSVRDVRAFKVEQWSDFTALVKAP